MLIANILLLIVTICDAIAYMPQILKLIKTKEAEDLSLGSWSIWVLSSVCYTSYAIFFSNEPMLIVSTLLELFCCLSILLLTIYYTKKKNS